MGIDCCRKTMNRVVALLLLCLVTTEALSSHHHRRQVAHVVKSLEKSSDPTEELLSAARRLEEEGDEDDIRKIITKINKFLEDLDKQRERAQYWKALGDETLQAFLSGDLRKVGAIAFREAQNTAWD